MDAKKKYKFLKKRASDLIFINAAISDEITKIQEKILRATEERMYLIQRLLKKQQHHGMTRKVGESTNVTGQIQKPLGKSGSQLKRKRTNKKSNQNNDEDDSNDDDGGDHTMGTQKKKPRTSHTSLNSVVPRKATLAPLDNSGRPIFPIELGTLTVYSIGEIVTTTSYHSTECIYPIGYCSTRLYISCDLESDTCLYTCKVTDAGEKPEFEILTEDSSHISFIGSSPDQSHQKLLDCINVIRGPGTVPSTPNGAAFFGLTHPTLQNLIQCFPGARKCSNYNWVKFEVNKDAYQLYVEEDPSVNINLL